MKSKFRLLIALLLLLLSMVSVAGATPSQPPSSLAPLVTPAGAKIIPHHYIVVLKANSSPQTLNNLTNLVETSGGKVQFTYTAALNGFSAYIPTASALEAVQKNSNVAYIEADQEIAPYVGWNLDRIDQRYLPLNNSYVPGADGRGVRVYVIDTGIRTTHVEFGGRAYEGYSAVGGNAQDCNGHGTHVAGIVGGTTYGVAKAVTLYAVRVFNCTGSGTTSGVIAGVNWVTANRVRPAVANMSLGGAASTALDSAVNSSINSGVIYTVAAGNSNANACNYSPARVPNAVTVAATTNTDARRSSSNFGSCVDLFAPGTNITSAWHTSDTATNTLSGTSMAAPHAAGVIALYLQGNPAASPATAAAYVVNNATTGVVTGAGTGSPNRLLYFKK